MCYQPKPELACLRIFRDETIRELVALRDQLAHGHESPRDAASLLSTIIDNLTDEHVFATRLLDLEYVASAESVARLVEALKLIATNEGVSTRAAWTLGEAAGELEYLLARVQADAERIERLTEERDARRESLAQEIRGVLRARNLWAPDLASDLIGAVAKALDDRAERSRG